MAMDKAEARLLLQSRRPNGADDNHPLFAEALALAGRDPDLNAWWQAQQEFDRRVATKLAQAPVPADLRETLLAGPRIVPFTTRYRLPIWFAAAAMIAIFTVAGVLVQSPASAQMASSEFESKALSFLGNNDPPLGMLSPEHDKVMAWLQEKNAPTGGIPGKMAAMPSVGCQQFAVHGHKVSLICFALADNKIVHLFVVDRDALSDAPGSSPQFTQTGGWSTASWSDDTHSYILATQAGPETLKQLL
jgi:hypothetical protein